MAKTWQFFDSANNIDLRTTRRSILLLRSTSVVHRDRDFEREKTQEVMDKINNDVHGHNWMKMHCRFEDRPDYDDVDLVIVYHLVAHRGKHWTVSVGFDQDLLDLSAAGGNPNDNNNPYVKISIVLNEKIRDDLNHIKPPSRRTWCSIEDVGTNADGSEPDPIRRATRIGELAYIAEHNSKILGDWPKVSRGREPKPPIPGWGRPGDTHVFVTEFSRDP